MFSNLIPFFNGALSLLTGRSSRTGMLYFHRIVEEPDPHNPDDLTPSQFEELVVALKQHFSIVTPEDWFLGKIPKNKLSIMISFDDGFKDNLIAADILEKHHCRGTFFVSTNWFKNDGKPMSLWHLRAANAVNNGRNIDVSALKFFSPDEINKTLQSSTLSKDGPDGLTVSDLIRLSSHGHCVGGHTRGHYILTTMTDEEAQSEIEGCYNDLRLILGPNKPLFFAYPNGMPERDFNEDHVKMVKNAGFSAAFGTHDGGFDLKPDENEMFHLPRFLPYQKTPIKRALASAKIIHEGTK